jgi:hypothetical protein
VNPDGAGILEISVGFMLICVVVLSATAGSRKPVNALMSIPFVAVAGSAEPSLFHRLLLTRNQARRVPNLTAHPSTLPPSALSADVAATMVDPFTQISPVVMPPYRRAPFVAES